MKTKSLIPIFDPMRYKGDFIGLSQKEDKVIIEYLVKALSQRTTLSERQQHVIDTAIQVMLTNYELKKRTFIELIHIFAILGMEPITFHRDKRGDYFSGSWYEIPANNPELAMKKLAIRKRKRMKAWENAWFLQFGTTYSHDEIEDVKCFEDHVKGLLGSTHKEINEAKDPKDVIVPFRR